MDNHNVVLQMKNITKRFPGVLALDNVSFSVNEGEIHALCGENGAGKSTLMKILSGSYPESSYEGNIYVKGKQCHFHTPFDSETTGIGMIYQEISMHLDMSIAENLFLGKWPQKRNGIIDWKKMKSDGKMYLDMVGLKISQDTILRQLSASQQQLVSIARALSKNPKILVLDEPTSPLTSKESDKLFSILHDLKSKGIACILITHKMEEVFTHSDAVTVIRDGKSVSTHSLDETSPKEIVKDMVGREIDNFYPKEYAPIGETVLEIKNLSVRHPSIPNRKIINNASFSLKKGQILGIAGLVGAGRSELVNAIFGKDIKLGGDIFIDGEKANIKSPKDAISYGLALATEERKSDGIILGMDIAENITLPNLKAISRYGIMNMNKEKDYTTKYFKDLRIKAPSIHSLLQQLSGGNQQKVIIAKWIARNPKVLILDEPTRGIDVSTKYEIYKIMVDLAKHGMGIIMISSELPELMSMSDQIIVIANNKISGIVDAKKTSQEDIMGLAAL